MTLLRSLFGPSEQERVWRELADRLGGRFVPGGLRTDVVQVRTGNWIVTLDTYRDGDDSPTYTRLRAPYVNPEGFRFTIYRSGLFTNLGKLLGMQDIEIGYPGFDKGFVVKANSKARVTSFLENPRIRDLLRSQPRVHLTVHGDEGWFGPRFPDGVDELFFRSAGVIRDLYQLRGLFDLFAESLNQLCHDGRAYDDDPRIHIRRLRGPGGAIYHKTLVLWEGDKVRREAAEALGRMKDPSAIGALTSVLDGGDDALRARAIEALGEIGSRRAIRPLVPQLGAAARVYDKTLGEWAAEALRKLGEAELADAVLVALEGSPSRLEGAVDKYRPQVVRALVAALSGPSAHHAATALQGLGATEALPQLREALRGVSPRSRSGRAIAAAVQELEARAALPRPAGAPARRHETLPRTAEEPGPASDTLPRPSGRDESP